MMTIVHQYKKIRMKLSKKNEKSPIKKLKKKDMREGNEVFHTLLLSKREVKICFDREGSQNFFFYRERKVGNC